MKLITRVNILFFLILTLCLTLRTYQIGSASLSGDESIGAIRAFWFHQGLLTGKLTDFYGLIVHSRPPMDILMSAPAFFLGATEFTIRLPYLFFFAISALVLSVYLYLKQNKLVGVLVFVFLSVSPMTVGWSRLSTVDSLELSVSCLLLAAIHNFSFRKTRRSLFLLVTLYAISFWFIETFILLVPLIGFVVVSARRKFSGKDLFFAGTIFIIIFSLVWAPRIYYFLFDPRITRIGFGYQVGKLGFPNPITNILYYFRTYFPQSTVWVFFLFIFLGTFRKGNTQDKIFRISTAYIGSYLIFFLLVFWRHQAYLGNIYIPLVVAGTISLKRLVSGKVFAFSVLALVVVQLANSFTYIHDGDSHTSAIWGFRQPDNLKEAAFEIRRCTLPSDSVLTDIDGYSAAIYFNRRTFTFGEKLRPKGDRISIPEAVYLRFGKNQLIDHSAYPIITRFSDSSTLFLAKCKIDISTETDLSGKHFLQDYWLRGDVISFYR